MGASTTASPLRLALILGGARSGKSAFAERLTEALSDDRIYIATGEAWDAEMAARIATHRERRGLGWRTVEAPRDAHETLRAETRPGAAALIDCLTLWLTNEMLRGDAEGADDDAERIARLGPALSRAAADAPCPVVAVSNEVGLGIVPDTPLGRRFRDAQGRLNQSVAAAADLVVFMAAGLPLVLKGESPI